MALIETLVDPFNQATLNTGLWSQFTAGSATFTYGATGAQVNFPATSSSSTDGDITSVSSYDLTGSYVYMQVLNTLSGTNNDCNLTLLSPNTSNAYQWQLEAGTLYAQRIKTGTQTNAFSIAYNATTMKWLRIANLSGTNITWDTSPDGVTWTNRLTFTNNLTITAVKVNIAAVSFGIDSSAGNFKWNNFNTTGAVAPSNTGAFFALM